MKLRISLLAIWIATIGLCPRLFAADSDVKGSFIGDGKPAKLAFVSALKGTTLADEETVMLVFTEKDHSKEKRPDMKASFGDFGSALIITLYPDTGKIVGCDVAHEAQSKKPFSSLGSIEMKDFKNEGGQISGKIVTAGKVETFKQTWEVDLTFRAKLP
jgi:hypothetical protein